MSDRELMRDVIVHGTAISKDGERIDPASIYKQPEPCWKCSGRGWYTCGASDVNLKCPECGGKPKPQREWQGLTDDQIDMILQRSPIRASYADLVTLVRAIEAKLREKNA